MEIKGEMDGGAALLSISHCPIGSVCKERGMAIDGSACQMFHYYIAGIMAEFTGRPTRPTTITTGETCTFKLAFAGAPRG